MADTSPLPQAQSISQPPSGDDYALCRSLLLELLTGEISMDDWVAQLTQQLDEAQIFVDFLSKVMEEKNTLELGKAKRVLKLLSGITKAAQVFPACYELNGVQCDLSQPHSEGGFGLVVRGTYGKHTVCVKAVRVYQKPDNNQKLWARAQAAEFTLWAHLSHQNIVPFYGLYLPENQGSIPRVCIVSPWMQNGDLKHYLSVSRDKSRILLLSDVASGLEYLHKSNVVHADLKANNVLVSNTGRAMITDFGISRIVLTSVDSTTGISTGTHNWTAPEVMINDKYKPTFESDIWSFACLCFEVITGEKPFNEYGGPQLMSAFLTSKTLNPMQVASDNDKCHITTYMKELLEKCWDHSIERRPKSEEITRFFQDLNTPDRRPLTVEQDAITRDIQQARLNVEINPQRVHDILQRIRGVTSIEERLKWPRSQSGLKQEERDAASDLLQYFENDRATSSLFSGKALLAFTVLASSNNPSLHRTAALLLADSMRKTENPGPIDQTVLEPILLLLNSRDIVAQTVSNDVLGVLLQTSSNNWPLIAEQLKLRGLEPLVRSLSSSDISIQQSAAKYLARLTSDENNIPEVLAAGALVPLIHLASSEDVTIQDGVILALANITHMDDESRQKVVDAGVISDLVNILSSKNTSVDTQKNCLQALENVSLNAEYRERMVRNEPRLIQCLLRFMEVPDIRIQERALQALENLCNDTDNSVLVVQQGALDKLIPLLGGPGVNIQSCAVRCVSNLAAFDDDIRPMIARPEILTSLIHLAQSRETSLQEAATGALLNLTCRLGVSYTGNQATVIIRILVGLLRSVNSMVQFNCIRALENIADADDYYTWGQMSQVVPTLVDRLVQLRQSYTVEVRSRAVRILRDAFRQ